VDKKVFSAIVAAINAYMESEQDVSRRRFGQRLNPWKMAARRETMSKRSLVVRANPGKIRLRRFSIF